MALYSPDIVVLAPSSRDYDALLLEWQPMLERLAQKRTQCPATADDLMQAGRVALLKAAEGFETGHGASFKTYACVAIKRAMKRELDKVRGRMNPTDTNLITHACPNTLIRVPRLVTTALNQWVASLPGVLADVFEASYELELTQRQIAVRLGVSQPRVNQLHRQLIQLARRQFGSNRT
jgi:RNA polymerase sigma factor (sigma-70 family)